MKINLDDKVQALLLLSSLPDSWNTFVVSLSNLAPEGKLTLKMVKNSPLNEEARRKEKKATICYHLLMHMWLKIKIKAMVEAK